MFSWFKKEKEAVGEVESYEQKVAQIFIELVESCDNREALRCSDFVYSKSSDYYGDFDYCKAFKLYFKNTLIVSKSISTIIVNVPKEDIELYLKVLKKVVNDINAEEKIKKERKRQENLKCLEKMINA